MKIPPVIAGGGVSSGIGRKACRPRHYPRLPMAPEVGPGPPGGIVVMNRSLALSAPTLSRLRKKHRRPQTPTPYPSPGELGCDCEGVKPGEG